MKNLLTPFIAGLVLTSLAGADEGFTPTPPPVPISPEMKVTRFADEKLLRHPIGMTLTRDGKLLAVESHTHLRPKTYNGPETDQIVWLQDTDGDGVADTRSVFFEGGLRATMNIATHPISGAIYAATKNGIHRFFDEDGDGIAEKTDRIIFFDFQSEYLDNGYGCAGLCFDKEGNLFFGIGGLLGAPYALKSNDGIEFKNQGEGGNIWKCTEDGNKLRLYSTGFWNPFGLCQTEEGFIFATDNDPSERPPSRLHHIIDGGDYGYQFRYGVSGHHPFIAWDGEIPGTLPMLQGTGDAPCDVIYHEGNLIVASWTEHRVEVYPLEWNQTHFKSAPREILLDGGHEFRPVGMAVGADGALYVTDWVKNDYQLHGRGYIWKIENWQPKKCDISAAVEFYKNPAGTDPENPWTFARMISGQIPADSLSGEKKQIHELLSARFHQSPEGDALIRKALTENQSSESLRLLALKWISDEKRDQHRDLVLAEVKKPASATLFHAAITANARIDGLQVMDDDMEKLLTSELDSESLLVRSTAFLLLANRDKIPVEKLRKIYHDGDKNMRSGVALTLREHVDTASAREFALEIVSDSMAEAKVRSFASLANPEGVEVRPSDSLEIGEFVFQQNCAKCHRIHGFGKKGGPDLSLIGVRGEEHIRQSIIDPSAEMAPMYETWKVTLIDGTVHLGFILGEKAGIHRYSDAAGNEFTIDTGVVAERERLPGSLMPPQLNAKMRPGDFDHLVHYLLQLK